MMGLLLKAILTRSNLGKDQNNTESLQDQFKFLSRSELVKVLEHGAELWMTLKKIHQTACNRSESQEANEHLRKQFDTAHAFFIEKMKQHKFNGVLDILGARLTAKNMSKIGGEGGLSSQ